MLSAIRHADLSQNSYAPRSKRGISRSEEQSCEPVNKFKKILCPSDIESTPAASHKAT
jgi:hypothetical protein